MLTKIGLNEFAERLPQKKRTLLYQENGEGVTPSGGEAQKVAIARALYKNAPFVILDEPTAALDPIAEAGIYENFDSLVGEKTAVYISHRMSSCKFCDRIVVLDHGEIAEEGTHEQLLEQNRDLCEALSDTGGVLCDGTGGSVIFTNRLFDYLC